MLEHTQVTTPPPTDQTVRFRRRLDDTQPTQRVTPPRPATPSRGGYHRRSCPSRLLSGLFLLAFAVAVLAAGGAAIWRWSTTLPRTNVLILGLDRRPEEGSVVRSDTMVLATVYPPGPDVALLSIPRDLYVEIPGHGTSRINTAHFWGENDLEGGGPRLAEQTVTQNFGVPIHGYVRIDFDGFRAVVDAAGGIDIVVEEPIVDDDYPTADYGTMRIEIPAGPQHMDGETALRYARSRHGSSDFGRVARQQQVIIALARRLLEPKAWPRLPAVYSAVKNNVDTDLTGRDLLLLAPTLYRVGPEGIEHRVVDRGMTQPWTTPSGGAVLLPEWGVIHPLVHELFTP